MFTSKHDGVGKHTPESEDSMGSAGFTDFSALNAAAGFRIRSDKLVSLLKGTRGGVLHVAKEISAAAAGSTLFDTCC